MREQLINELKNETKRMLNMLDYVRWWNKRYILEKSDSDLRTLITICKFFEKSDDYGCAEKERELEISAKKE